MRSTSKSAGGTPLRQSKLSALSELGARTKIIEIESSHEISCGGIVSCIFAFQKRYVEVFSARLLV
jgi:hypothetical protein